MRGVTLKRRSDPKAAAHLTEWLERLRQDHVDRILPVTDRIALEWGRVAALRSRGDIDGLIAATAIVHGLILVTRNVKDFDDTRASLINPWSNEERSASQLRGIFALCCATGIIPRTLLTLAGSMRAETMPTPSEALAITWPQGSATREWP